MVEICFRTGDVHGAARYCRKLLEQSDRLNFPDGSSDFKNLLYEYASLQYEYDITRQSLELSENRRTTALLAFFISVAALGAAFALLLYARQRRKNKRLIAQYEEYRKRLLTENSVNDRTAADHRSDIHYALYLKMEQLMKGGLFPREGAHAGPHGRGAWHQPHLRFQCPEQGCRDLLLRLHRLLPHQGGDPCAVRSRTCSDGLSQQLADDVGYNNIQTFFKAFKRETGVTPGNYKKELFNLHKFTQGEQ